MYAPKVSVEVDTATGWGRRIITGVLDYAKAHGPWDLWIEPKGQTEVVQVFAKSGFEGIIARVVSTKQAEFLKATGIPIVNISGQIIEGADFPRVIVDTVAATELAEAHFRDRALRHFAYVGPMHLPYVRSHEQAFEQTLSKTGTPCHIFSPPPGNYPIPWPAKDSRLVPWIQSLPKPIGIYTWGFQIGRDIISACRDADIPIPHDIAVLGGDFDSLLSDACQPSLSGVVTPAREIGYEASRILHDMMQGKPGPVHPVLIAPDVIEERLSTDMIAIEEPHIQQALRYLREHACEEIAVDDILKAVPMARRLLERKFMQYLGRTPAQEIRCLRINKARRLLTQTNLQMQEIAEACGYGTYNYLSTIFKRETGLSPGQYRKKTRHSVRQGSEITGDTP